MIKPEIAILPTVCQQMACERAGPDGHWSAARTRTRCWPRFRTRLSARTRAHCGASLSMALRC